MRSSFTPGSASLIAWVCVMIATVVWTASAVTSRTWLRSNVFELLPDSEYDALKETATRVVETELGAQLLFLIGHADRNVAMESADRFGARLRESPLIASVMTRVDTAQYSTIADFYYPFRRQILSDDQFANIIDDGASVARNALATIYSPLGAGRGDGLITDPFFLFPASLQALQPSSGSLELDGTYLWAGRGDLNYVFIMARIGAPTLSIVEQEDLAQHLDAATREALAVDPGIHFLKTGFFFFAHAGTQSAKNEISVIGLGSLVGLVMLVLWTFRSLRPLFLIALSVVSGCLFAVAITLGVFGFVHLFTLVFGASLIGVSVDYSFHYAADDAFGGKDWTPAIGLRRIFMGITLGLLTSILAYLALTVAPFPGLQQLAVFSSAGLVGAYLTLICCCRLWRRRLSVDDRSVILRAVRWYLAVWRHIHLRQRYLLVGVLAAVILTGSRLIEVNDDVRVLQSRPDELTRQELVIQELLGLAPSGTFLIASAPSDEALLQLEESVRVTLDGMIQAGTLSSYQAVSRWVPSRARQARSLSAYINLISTRLPDYFQSLGIPEETTASVVAEFSEEVKMLEARAWLEHPVSDQFRNLWLETAEYESASIILLSGLRDTVGLKSALADVPSIVVVNKAQELSNLFGRYRVRVTWVLAVAYFVIFLSLAARYGVPRAAVLLVPPVFAGALALICISITGQSVNLFHFLAMILVLGIGIDFTLFLAEAVGDLKSTMFAITLSALTTMLSFGLLSLSSTYAVHSFGLTVLIGIAFAYLLSPLAISKRPRPHTE